MVLSTLVFEKGGRGLIKRLVVVVVLLCAFGVGGVAAHLAVLSNDLPDLSSLSDYKPPVTSKVFDHNGNLVARFYEERRTVVPIEKIPDVVKNAFISAEDEEFYKHTGIDYLAILRCGLLSVKRKIAGGGPCGGSTITQQTAQTFLLSMEHNYSNKVKKLLLARRIEEKLSKDQILFLYLNQIYFGNGAYGIDEAARTYYGVGVDKLTLAQAASLASIPKSPNRINPVGRSGARSLAARIRARADGEERLHQASRRRQSEPRARARRGRRARVPRRRSVLRRSHSTTTRRGRTWALTK